METTSIKVVLLGNPGVGKSSLALRFAEDEFNPEHTATIGAAYLSRVMTIRNKSVKFNIWDTAGQERYRSMARIYYQDAHAAVLVYDVSNKESFTELSSWHKELKEHGLPNITLAIAANKCDLEEVVDSRTAKVWADNIGAGFRRTSTKESVGVEELFAALGQEVRPTMCSFETGVRLDKNKVQAGGCRC